MSKYKIGLTWCQAVWFDFPMINTYASLTPAEKKYIESQGDPGTDFYWMAIERVMSDRVNAALANPPKPRRAKDHS